MTSQPSFSRFFPLLSSLAECCLSIPVSNTWPERGASALKRNKTRLRNKLKNDMLQSLLQISINGPSVESDACVKIVRSAIDAWNRAKRRRRWPQVGGNTASTPDADVAQVQVADAAVQVQVDDDEYQEQVVQQMNIEAEVQAATAALKLVEDEFDAKDDLADSDYD